jgi:hypothetical protein
MSIYGYICCHDCQELLWLGKWIRPDTGGNYFHIGDENEPYIWESTDVGKALIKFLASHADHNISCITESDDIADKVLGYKEIGGEESQDIPFSEYLSGWKGQKKT